MRVEIDQGQEQQAHGRAEYATGETPETGSVGAFLKTTLWELLAIGLVGLATYLMVSLIIWITTLL
jgi:hypothetical protein